ncbi:MAG: alanine racemase [Deltaproteobacteria bacterium]|jgi:alanine racemase|nr:alanine racemase [Deltaproteobacteria bacterium]
MTERISAFNTCYVDLGALARNYKKIVAFTNGQVMAVIKGDAYGHGLIPCARSLAAVGCTQVGVLDLEEALALKKCGFSGDIHILAGLHGMAQSLKAVETQAVVLAYDLGQIKTLSRAAEYLNLKARIRLKIDTGMGRLGIPWEKATYTVSNLLTLKNIQLEGLATHLATNGDEEADLQLTRFIELGRSLKKSLSGPNLFSALASGGILAHQNFPEDLAAEKIISNKSSSKGLNTGVLHRVGLLLYGYSPIDLNSPVLNKRAKNLIKSLEPVMTVKSKLISVKNAKPGETISYDRTYKATKNIQFGVVPIGYVHGLSRTRSGQGFALVNGQKAKLLGRICMNLSMYDLTGLSPEPGDEVVLLGRQADQVIGADLAGTWQKTSAYEMLCLLGNLNPREYYETLIPN